MEHVLEVRGVTKCFPGVRALDQVNFSVRGGEVHALLGENGAGKSTLMKILAGLLKPDSGELIYKGENTRFRFPHDALERGISMIHQELMPFSAMTIGENIFMGREPVKGWLGWVDRRRMYRESAQLLSKLAVQIPPQRRMNTLRVAEMQTVEIARALAFDADVIIMDEPTSALSEGEAERLFKVIEELKTRGVSIIYISHKLDEIFRVADRVTVLRDGKHVRTEACAALNHDLLIRLMVGRALDSAAAPPHARQDSAALSVRGLTRPGHFENVTFEVNHGEILGIAGLMGAGRTELVSAIYGLAPMDAGEIAVHGQPVRIRNPREAIARGIAMVTENRQEYGFVPNMSVMQNITLSMLKRYCRGGFVKRHAERAAADQSIADLRIKTASRDHAVGGLSGGNQQKVVIAKALLTEPDIIILDEPTRGIDIGAKAEIYALIRRLAGEGKAVIVVSSELPEILALCGRVLVMREGEVSAELDGAKTNQEEIMRHAVPS